MGSVYEAVQEDLGRRVAVKVLHKARLANENAVARFRVEAETSARLGSPHIVLVTDFQAGGSDPPFLVMELLLGKSLRRLIADEGVLDWHRVAGIGAQILAALAAAHAAKILHRDIKPDNVFVSPSPALGDVVKVLDFGVAKLMEDDGAPITADGVLVGTPQYMAPEQIDGRTLDARTDLYAVAACLYEAVSGQVPLLASDSRVQLDDVLHRAPPRLDLVCPKADPRFAAIVMRGLHKDPDARFQSAEDMSRELKALDAALHVGDDAATIRQPHTETPTRDEEASSEIIATRPHRGTLPAVSALRPIARPVPAAPPSKPRSRLWLWIGLVLGLVVAIPIAIVAGVFGYYVHLTNVCKDTSAAVSARLDACESACGHDDENRQYCTVQGDLLTAKGDSTAAGKAYGEACKAGDAVGCARLTTTRKPTP